jgi:hypothetical protein
LYRKVKGKAVLVFNEAPHHEDVWGSRGTAPPFLTSELDGDWSASRPDLFTPQGKHKPISTEQRAGWAPQPVWKLWRRGRIALSYRELKPGRPARSPSLYLLPYTLYSP